MGKRRTSSEILNARAPEHGEGTQRSEPVKSAPNPVTPPLKRKKQTLKKTRTEQRKERKSASIKQIRTSVGGLKELSHVLEQLKTDNGITLLFAQHLDRKYGHKLRRILSGVVPKQNDTRVPALREALVDARKEVKKGAGELHRLSQELKNIFNNIPLPTIIVGRNLQLRFATRGARHFLGIDSVDPKRKITNTVLGLYIPDLRKQLARVVETREAVKRDILDEEGRWQQVRIHPYQTAAQTVDGAVITLVDVTDRNRAVEMLQSEQNRQKELLNAIGGIFVLLDSSENVAMINRKGCEALGCTEGEVLGKNWFANFLPEEHRSEARAAFLQLMSNGKGEVISSEVPLATRDGRQRLVRWHTKALTDSSGNRVGVVSSGEDITAWRAKELSAKEIEERFHMVMELERENDFLTTDPNGNVRAWYPGTGTLERFQSQDVQGNHFSMFFRSEDFLAGKPMKILRLAETHGRYEEDTWCVAKDGSLHRARITACPIRDPEGKLTGFSAMLQYRDDYARFQQN